MPPRDAFSRLLDDDDLDPPGDLPAWEGHGSWYMMFTPKGTAVIIIPPGESGYGIVRFPDRSAVVIPPGSAKTIFEQAEGILHDGPPVWDRLDRDYLDPNRVEKPKPVPIPELPDHLAERREAPRRWGSTEAFTWDFKRDGTK